VRRRTLLGLGVSLFAFPNPALGAVRTNNLFVLARSSNANVVHYDVRLTNGRLDLDEPLVAYWVMRAEDGRREGLTWFERELAYGFRLVSSVTDEGFRVVLTAFSRRAIGVRKGPNGSYGAHIRIDGKSATLARIFVNVAGSGATASVRFIELIGSRADGTPVSERIVP
jgi:uncharacterized protein DUF4833